MTPKRGAALFFFAIAVVVGVRIAWVNSGEAPDYPTEHFRMGEWVDLGGAFFQHANESTEGYSIRINGAKIMTCAEYLEAYGQAEVDLLENADEKNVIAIEYEVRNTGNTDGAILLFLHKLLGGEKNTYYECDPSLWNASQPQQGGTMGFAVLEGTTFSLVAPFTSLRQPDYLESYDQMKRISVSENSFELVLSQAPVRKVVDVIVES